MQSIINAIVFSGGSYCNPDNVNHILPEDALVVCADSGVLLCEKFKKKANIVVGDFDSADYEAARKLSCAKNAHFIHLNPEKDDTDTEFALNTAIIEGCKTIYLIGGTGTRLDHTLSNIFLMEKCYKAGVDLIIVNDNNIVYYIKDNPRKFKKNNMKYISLIPLEDIDVSNSGFYYPLNNETLHRDSSRGISNELIEEFGIITLKRGCALVVQSKD